MSVVSRLVTVTPSIASRIGQALYGVNANSETIAIPMSSHDVFADRVW